MSSLLSMQLYSIISILLGVQQGFHSSRWKQSRVEHANRPFGVVIVTNGGSKGYCGGGGA